MRLYDSSTALVDERVNETPRFNLRDVPELPTLDATGKIVCFSEVTDQDKLELGFIRTEHVRESVLVDCSLAPD